MQVEYVTLSSEECIYTQTAAGVGAYNPGFIDYTAIWRWQLPENIQRARSGSVMISLVAVTMDLGTQDTGNAAGRVLTIQEQPQNCATCKNSNFVVATFTTDPILPASLNMLPVDMPMKYSGNQSVLTFEQRYTYSGNLVDVGLAAGIVITLKLVYPEQNKDQLAASLISSFEQAQVSQPLRGGLL